MKPKNRPDPEGLAALLGYYVTHMAVAKLTASGHSMPAIEVENPMRYATGYRRYRFTTQVPYFVWEKEWKLLSEELGVRQHNASKSGHETPNEERKV